MVSRASSPKRKTKKTEPEANVNNPFIENKYINTGDFCSIVATDILDPNVRTGDIVWVAGLKAVPMIEDDPYTQRIVMLVHRVLDDHIMSQGLYVIDPAGLAKVDNSVKERLAHQLTLDYPATIETSASVN